MSTNVFDRSMFLIFCKWIAERETIRQKKERGDPKPWTKDPLLRNYRWCNVRRMDDRVSQWLLKNWYHPGGDPATLVLMACIARMFNWPDSLAYSTLAYSPSLNWNSLKLRMRVAHRFHEWEDKGNKVFTGAYIVNGGGGGSKIDQVLSNIAEVWTAMKDRGLKTILNKNSMQETCERLMEFHGFGSFMAGQIVADLRHTNAMPDPGDRMTWAPMGPGSKRGLRRLCGKEPDGPVDKEAFIFLLTKLIDDTREAIPEVFKDRKLEAMDIQNCLCEFDKYRRLTLNEGSVRSTYDGDGSGIGDLL